jgi:hypothetical protein
MIPDDLSRDLRAELAAISGEFTAMPSDVHCPCGSRYVHPVAVTVNRGGRITTVDADDVANTIGPPGGFGRGVSIETFFDCEECQRRFVVSFSFHKGGTVIDVTLSDEEPTFRTLWRE